MSAAQRPRKRPYAERAAELRGYAERIMRTVAHFELEAEREETLAQIADLRAALASKLPAARRKSLQLRLERLQARELQQWHEGAARRDQWRSDLCAHEIYIRFAAEAERVAAVERLADSARFASPDIEAHRGPATPSAEFRTVKSMVKRMLPRP